MKIKSKESLGLSQGDNMNVKMNNSLYDYSGSPTVHLKFRFCISQCNPETSLQFMGIWRPVLRTLLHHVASIYDKKPRKILMQMIEGSLSVSANKL